MKYQDLQPSTVRPTDRRLYDRHGDVGVTFTHRVPDTTLSVQTSPDSWKTRKAAVRPRCTRTCTPTDGQELHGKLSLQTDAQCGSALPMLTANKHLVTPGPALHMV